MLIPFWDTTPSSYKRLQALMSDPKTIIVEARATPHVPQRPEWCRWGERGLQTSWDPRYYHFSSASYGSGGDTENWLGMRHEQQLELEPELVNAEWGIRFLSMELARGRSVVLLCSQDEHGQVITALLRKRMPGLPGSSCERASQSNNEPERGSNETTYERP